MRNSEITTRVANNDVHVTKASFALSSAAGNHLRAVDERFKSAGSRRPMLSTKSLKALMI